MLKFFLNRFNRLNLNYINPQQMKKSFSLLAICILFCNGKNSAQTFSPIALTGYNYDAVAEANTASATTTGPIDGSNYVLYSAAYGALYSSSYGLPNNGIIASGTSTYQLGTYSVNNVCYTTATPSLSTDSLTFVTPASYSGVGILCFSTEGNGTLTATVRFTDNTTQVFAGLGLLDWYGTSGSPVFTNFDRVNRTGTTPSNGTGSRMYTLSLPITCANRVKLIKNIKFQNTGNNPRNLIMAISGAAMPAYTVTSGSVSCNGGTDGSASIVSSGGIQPYTYTWSTTPAQNGASVGSLVSGIYTVTAQDAGLCPVNTTVSVGVSTVPQPPLSVGATSQVICAGTPVLIGGAGTISYTWSTTDNTNTISVTPAATSVYTVGGFTSFNCYRSGSITITVNPLPVITFTTPASACINGSAVLLTANPTGGTYAGIGVTLNSFSPASAGVGTKTISYVYTDANGCTSSALNTVVVNAKPVVTFTLSPNSLCTNSSTFNLIGSPSGGTFVGTGVTGSVYSPSLAGMGTQSVTYSYMDANTCTNQVTSSVMINSLPALSFITTKKVYSVCSQSVYLNAQPSGGIFSGPGTSTAGIFSPSVAGAGTHSIIYSFTDLNSCSNTTALSVTVTSCTGINEHNLTTEQFAVYPNPNNGAFTVKATGDIELTLTNDLGQAIRFLKLTDDNAHESQVSDLSSGIYFITGQNNFQVIKQKIIVTK